MIIAPRGPSRTIARGVGVLSRRLGRGGGTSAPGRVLLRLRPDAIQDLAGSLSRGSLVVSATNGKTTTARLIASCIASEGWPVVANRAGANLVYGVATALLDGAHARPTPEIGLFEVDEFALPGVVARLAPRVVVLMNLFRDQLDRYGELEAITDAWARMISNLPEQTVLVLNADDPAIASLADGVHRTLFFGIDDPAVAIGALPHAADSIRCRVCDGPLAYTRVALGHMGVWHCPTCGARRPDLDISARSVRLDGTRAVALEILTPTGPLVAQIALPGVHNAYNATAAAAAAVALDIAPATIGPALAAAEAAFGRAERVQFDGRELVLLLAKNPAGANVTVQTVALDPDPLHLLIALNDRTADGKDVSWIWDVDYEPLLERIGSLVVTGDRAYDMALRFVYAGLDRSRVHIVPEPGRALDLAVSFTPAGRPLYVLPTYTAMLDLRAILVARGAADAYWAHD
jgi:lipid II isoglutaminyl synthase (glutamine-hydrolysing)